VTTILSPIGYKIHVDGDKGYKWIQLVSRLHVTGVNAALEHKNHAKQEVYVKTITAATSRL